MDSTAKLKTDYQKVIESLREDLKIVRTGRANSSIIENLIVEAYGGQTKLRLMELSTINSEGPATLVISPFDPSTIIDIEKAILKSPLGLSPQTQGSKIFIRIPSLSGEQREKMMKLVGQTVEEKRSILRNLRDEARKKVRQELEEKLITEDDKFRLEKEFDTITQNFTGQIQLIKEAKEKEIMEV